MLKYKSTKGRVDQEHIYDNDIKEFRIIVVLLEIPRKNKSKVKLVTYKLFL